MGYRIGLIEDEPSALERLQRMVMEFEQEFTIAWTADSVMAALACMRNLETYDAIITDVQLADGTCFDLFELFKPTCPVVFVTAYDQYAIDAFVVHTIDYLQKPLKRDQMQVAMKKLHTRLDAGGTQIDYAKLAEAIGKTEGSKAIRYVIRFGEQMRIITTEEIAYIYTLQKSVFAVLHSGKTYPMDKTMDQLERECDEQFFFRINRQMIVSRQSIGPMQIVTKSRVQITLVPPFQEYDCVVSTERSPIFKDWIAR